MNIGIYGAIFLSCVKRCILFRGGGYVQGILSLPEKNMKNHVNCNNDKQVFDAAYAAWTGWAALRGKRRRNKDFTYGSQWGDTVTDADGRRCSEYRRLQESGHEPLTNNVIRRLVRSVVGRFRNSIAAENNSIIINELDSRALEEFLISGCCLQRVDTEGTVENLNPNRFFSNVMEDVHCRDCKIAGYLHDLNVGELISMIARGDRNLARRIREIYTRIESPCDTGNEVGSDAERGGDFFSAANGLVRAIEVWTLELQEVLECHDCALGELYVVDTDAQDAIDAENLRRRKAGVPEVDARWSIEETWHCRWFAPDAHCLTHYTSPYGHGSHPFVIKLYPLTDGEVHSFVEDIIDQQKYINRLITLIDHVMGSSAKGVLLFPDSALPEGFTWQDMKRIWRSTDGILPYAEGCCTNLPQQIASNNTNIGAYELLSLQMRLVEEISGMGSVLQGNTSAGTRQGAQLYERQVENATIALADIFETFNTFRLNRNAKLRMAEPSESDA